jgi:geranyl-CoA carboxylase alpha subunit
MFDTLLIANRGEIACRVIRTAQSLGYRAIAVYSEADAGAPHVALADEALCIGPAPVGESYLDPARLLSAAKRSGAQAIHPGYGFLSENAAFARACHEAGLIFVGPPPNAIEAMGDKARSKVRMRASGVPTIPGYDDEDQSDAALQQAAASVGFPLLVKASAGGGGRGMRRVNHPDELPEALRSARAEAESAFGSGRLLLERLVEGARHVEVQVFADQHGNVIHLGERDCSVQRRHQKVVEEAPSPAVDAALRARMGEAACAAARAVGYVGAGTVEFLLDADKHFYFLEMNTRLQVEHPVTEMITGLGLVAWQLAVASGARLPLTQEQVSFSGHAIEVRLYAEDPAHGYAPSTGPIRLFAPPSGEGVRVDAGVVSGQEVSAFYDPMLAKIIAHGPDRDTARRRLLRALRGTVLFGFAHNLGFLSRVLADPIFSAGEATTAFLGRPEAATLTQTPAVDDASLALGASLWIDSRARGHGWRIAHHNEQPLSFSLEGKRRDVVVRSLAERVTSVRVGSGSFRVELLPGDGPWRRARIDGHDRAFAFLLSGGELFVSHAGHEFALTLFDPSPAKAGAGASDGRCRAPSAARVRAVKASLGQIVRVGEALVIVEAMKLETTLKSAVEGTVREIRVKEGDAVSAGEVLVVVAPLVGAEEKPA